MRAKHQLAAPCAPPTENGTGNLSVHWTTPPPSVIGDDYIFLLNSENKEHEVGKPSVFTSSSRIIHIQPSLPCPCGAKRHPCFPLRVMGPPALLPPHRFSPGFHVPALAVPLCVRKFSTPRRLKLMSLFSHLFSSTNRLESCPPFLSLLPPSFTPKFFASWLLLPTGSSCQGDH